MSSRVLFDEVVAAAKHFRHEIVNDLAALSLLAELAEQELKGATEPGALPGIIGQLRETATHALTASEQFARMIEALQK